jgi:hypothetical protein
MTTMHVVGCADGDGIDIVASAQFGGVQCRGADAELRRQGLGPD